MSVQSAVDWAGISLVSNEAMAAVAKDPLWEEPVSAVGRGLELFTIHSPGEALEFLISEWPARQGVFFAQARDAAAMALGDGCPVIAREAFVTACEDAACLVRLTG